jgi:hypothetical protein
LSIPTPAAAPSSQYFWSHKHDMPDLLIGGRFGSPVFHARCPCGSDQPGEDDKRHVQRRRRSGVRERP